MKINPLLIALAAAIGLSMAACPLDVESNDAFVPVASITRIPKLAEVGETALNGTVNPSNATNKTIEWVLTTTGTTGATLTGSTLKTTGIGTVVVTAKIRNGAAESAEWTQEFEIGIVPVGSIPTVTSVTVDPPSPNVRRGQAQQFTAAVAGTNNPSQDVAWSIVQSNKHSGTTINNDGLLTVDYSESLSALTVRATETTFGSVFGETTVSLYTGADIPVDFVSVSAQSLSPGSSTTTHLLLTFSQPITGLSTSDITLSGLSSVSKVALSGTGPAYTLSISNTGGGTVTVEVNKSGYTISNRQRSVIVTHLNLFYGTWGGSFPITAGNSTVNIQATLVFSADLQWKLKTNDNQGISFDREGKYTYTDDSIEMTTDTGLEFGDGTLNGGTLSLKVEFIDLPGIFTK